MQDNEEILRLCKRRKKGVLRVVFGRTGVILLLVAIQIAMLFVVFRWFEKYFGWFSAAQAVFSVAMILYLFNCGMDNSAKLTWLILMMLFPVPSTVFFMFTKADIGHKALKDRVEQLISETMTALPQDESVLDERNVKDPCTDALCRYINRSGCFPIYRNTSAVYFPLGEKKYAALIEELKKAEKFIFLEYFIIDEGQMWGRVLAILAEKAKQGVEVRLMYDGMCEIALLPHDYPKRLERLGIKCRVFAPIAPFLSTHYNYRDHRKILVIDGNVAFTGGVNLADEYINRGSRFGHWKDTAIMLKGEAVTSFTLMFLQMWNINEKTPDWSRYLTPAKPVNAVGYVMPFGDIPLDNEKVGECVYMDILGRASRYVHIMTPYLILDGELEAALKYAAERGVDVKLILPGIPDKKAAYALAKTHYKSLISSGVKIYEYTPGFVHAKVFVSDDIKAVVGTINLDYRSLYHHFECAAYMYGTDCIPDIERDFNETLAKCRAVTHETIKHEKLGYKVAGAFMKIIAPLM